MRLGVVIDGVYHWRAYSLTSNPAPEDGLISVTPKKVDSGVVSPYLVQKIQPGELVRLGEIEGVFTLPEPLPAKMLFISAGSGITPIMSMLRSLDHRGELGDVVVIPLRPQPRAGHVFVRPRIPRSPPRANAAGSAPHLGAWPTRAGDLDEECPDWREREAFCSGPSEMLDALIEHWESNGDPDRLHFERFQPKIGGDADAGEGGEVCFLDSEKTVECDGGTSILEAGEKAGLNLAYGCRIGICHTCVGTLKSGKLRDLRSG